MSQSSLQSHRLHQRQTCDKCHYPLKYQSAKLGRVCSGCGKKNATRWIDVGDGSLLCEVCEYRQADALELSEGFELSEPDKALRTGRSFRPTKISPCVSMGTELARTG